MHTFMQRRQGEFPAHMRNQYSLGIDIGSTTVKIAIMDGTYMTDRASLNPDAAPQGMVFSDYERHYANIQETLATLLRRSYEKLGPIQL